MSRGPAARKRRVSVHVLLAVAAVVVLYATVVALFAAADGDPVRLSGSTGFSDPIMVEIEPRRVDAPGRAIAVLLTPDPATGPIQAGDGYSFDEDTALVVSPSNGQRQIDFPNDRIVESAAAEIPFDDGAVETWPFDSYRVEAVVVMAAQNGGNSDAVPTDYTVRGAVPGWVIDVTALPPIGAERPLPSVEITAHRPVATIAFAIVLLALMIVMPVLVLTIAISAFRGRRKVEATLMSWMGAMLFATIPLRNFFPGSPPIGSWVDYLVVLWVIAGLIAGLGIFAAAWMRWTPPGGPLPRR